MSNAQAEEMNPRNADDDEAINRDAAVENPDYNYQGEAAPDSEWQDDRAREPCDQGLEDEDMPDPLITYDCEPSAYDTAANYDPEEDHVATREDPQFDYQDENGNGYNSDDLEPACHEDETCR